MLAELLRCEGVVEHCELRSTSIGFLALHGGLEAMTYEIAREAAARAGASLYAVVQPAELKWHIPSSRYRVEQSASLGAFCSHVDVAVSIHGYGGVRSSERRWTTAVVGGANRELAGRLADQLRASLDDYCWMSELDEMPAEYRGIHPHNPVNRPRGGGVQIELPPRVRGISPVWTGAPRNRHGFVAHTETLVETLASFSRGGSCR